MAASYQEEIAKELTLALIPKLSFTNDATEAANEVSQIYKILVKAVEEGKRT